MVLIVIGNLLDFRRNSHLFPVFELVVRETRLDEHGAPKDKHAYHNAIVQVLVLEYHIWNILAPSLPKRFPTSRIQEGCFTRYKTGATLLIVRPAFFLS